MKKYAKIVSSIVVQTQPNEQDGFVEVDDNVICGMVQNGEIFEYPLKDLETIRILKLNEIKESFETESNKDIEYNGNIYHGGQQSGDSIKSYSDLQTLKGIDVFFVTDINKDPIQMTDSEIKDLLILIGDSVTDSFFNSQTKEKAINDAETIEDIELIQW